MAFGAGTLRRFLLAATLLPLAFHVQEVKAEADSPSTTEETGGSGTPPQNTEAVVRSDEATGNVTNLNQTDVNATEIANITVTTESDCPDDCYEDSLFEVLAICDQKLIAFKNLCYYYQHKCLNEDSGCKLHCCLYPGTNITSATKLDCDDFCGY